MQEAREMAEAHSEDESNKSTEVEEDIRKLMNKHGRAIEKAKEIPVESIESTISLLKQLTLQYDELEALFKTLKKESNEDFPIELVGEVIKSSKISPALCKMIESLAEQNKALQKQNDLSKVAEATIKSQQGQVNTLYRTARLETKYLNQTVNEATKEIKKQKEEAAAQRKRIFELEASLESQKKIVKELLRDKKVNNKEIDIHEEEKKVLQGIIEHKDKEIEKAKRKEEEASYEKKKAQREYEVLQIQYDRLKKRAELKEKALNSCTLEMERLIKQLDRISRSDMQKKERLEYLEISSKKRDYEETQSYAEARSKAREGRRGYTQSHAILKDQKKSQIKAKEGSTLGAQKKAKQEDSRAASYRSTDSRNTQAYPEVIPDESDESESSRRDKESITDIPVSFSQAVDDASVSDLDDTGSSNKTATSFKEMQRKTEEMTKKFRELENLLSEIKRSNDSELDKVEERISYKK